MSLRIVDKKRVDMTDNEWELYQKIVQSYTTETNRGEDLFIDLFETNDEGIIVFIKPPSKRHTSMEVFLFITTLFHHQHIRNMYKEVEGICNQMKEKINEVDLKLKQFDNK